MKLSVRGNGLGGAIVVESDEGDELMVSKELNAYSALQVFAEWFNERTSKLEAEAAALDGEVADVILAGDLAKPTRRSTLPKGKS